MCTGLPRPTTTTPLTTSCNSCRSICTHTRKVATFHHSRQAIQSFIYLSIAPGSPSELPVGTFSEDDYDLSGALDMTLDNEEGRYYVEEGSASSDLVITRDGNNYTISIPSLEIVYSDPKEVGSGRWNSTTVNWNYTGTVKKAPQY